MSAQRPFPCRRGRPLSPFGWQTWRGYCNAKRLGYEASILASVHGAIRLGVDRELCLRLGRAGLGEDAVTAVRFRVSGGEYGVILPTYRTWRHARPRGLAFAVGRRALTDGYGVLIVSPTDVQQEPRLSNAHRIAHEKLVPACGDARSVARCIEELGGEAPLAACEAALASPLARGRIFGLVFGGQLDIDFSAEITDRSIVRLRPPCWAFDWDALGWHPIQSNDEPPAAPPEPHPD